MKKISIILLLFIIFFIFSGMKRFDDNLQKQEDSFSELEYIVEDSYLQDFYVSDGKWIARERICIKNHSTKALAFKLSADFPDDFKSGYVKEECLKGYLVEDSNFDEFKIQGNKTILFTVYFIGTSSGKEMKFNRNPIPKSNLHITEVVQIL